MNEKHEALRAEFETWALLEDMSVSRHGPENPLVGLADEYVDDETHSSWRAWQAARAQPAAEPAPDPEVVASFRATGLTGHEAVAAAKFLAHQPTVRPMPEGVCDALRGIVYANFPQWGEPKDLPEYKAWAKSWALHALGLIEQAQRAAAPQPAAQKHTTILEAAFDDLYTAPQPAAPAVPQGCACRWGADDKRIATCERHQGWLDVVQEWAARARDAEVKLAAAPQPPAVPGRPPSPSGTTDGGE